MQVNIYRCMHASLKFLISPLSRHGGNFNSRHKKELREIPPEDDLPSAFRLRKRADAFRLKKKSAVAAMAAAANPQQDDQGELIYYDEPKQQQRYYIPRSPLMASPPHFAGSRPDDDEVVAVDFDVEDEDDDGFRPKRSGGNRVARANEFRLKRGYSAFRLRRSA